jgi:dTDP-4-amino-4,6-dideoxygalactose transaminase
MKDLQFAWKHIQDASISRTLVNDLLQYHHLPHIYLTSSGTAALFLILKTLQKRSSKKEVIIPAYCARTVVSAVLQAGLKPVLCDISLDDFNIDTQSILRSITSETLAIVCAHMFGIPMKDIVTLRYKLPPDLFIIEDFCQAMGSKINGIPVGNWGDFAFTSFNRGKNVPAYGGGYALTQNHTLAQDFEQVQQEYTRAPGVFDNQIVGGKLALLALCMRPFWYGAGFPVISRFKDQVPPVDVEVKPMLPVQSAMVDSLLRHVDTYADYRYELGHHIIRELQNLRPIFLAKMPAYVLPSFNRFPIVFKDVTKLQTVKRQIERIGLETSAMYTRPLHQDFDLGYTIDEFPHSRYFAQHLLTVPVHPFVTEAQVNQVIEIVRSIC